MTTISRLADEHRERASRADVWDQQQHRQERAEDAARGRHGIEAARRPAAAAHIGDREAHGKRADAAEQRHRHGEEDQHRGHAARQQPRIELADALAGDLERGAGHGGHQTHAQRAQPRQAQQRQQVRRAVGNDSAQRVPQR